MSIIVVVVLEIMQLYNDKILKVCPGGLYARCATRLTNEVSGLSGEAPTLGGWYMTRARGTLVDGRFQKAENTG